MEQGRRHPVRSHLKLSPQCFTNALELCETDPCLENRKYLTVGNIGRLNRLLERYTKAPELLQQALALADSLHGPPLQERGILVGELGALYRQTNRHKGAREMFASQYNLAKKMGWKGQVCRVIGNIGMANCQLARQIWRDSRGNGEAIEEAKDLTHLAITQLKDRVQLALDIQEEEDAHAHS
ncbi:hypothetical protein QBC36DRAFT_304850 [Triangularia setosa]|uniref:Tetratricopeptide repeat protein n=1 Tax=Triangularia setosa TaxID=2587417 RepID=A0AAN7A2T2_9PEZI|nr:hypothetical protein QBC36DRAFT_304850 [Podospora setosa]